MNNLDIYQIKKECSEIKVELSRQLAQKEILDEQLLEIENKILETEELIESTNSAFYFLKQRAADTRSQAIPVIEKAVSDGLSYMFQEEYLFRFKSNESSTSDISAFNLVAKVYKQIDGEIVERCPYSSNGGGLQEIISILLRFSFIVYRKYNGIVILDEALASVSADKMMDRLIEFLKSYVETLGLQCVFITHRADRFVQISNKNFLVTRENGLAVVNEMTKEEMLDYYKNLQEELA
jgi:ABC-type dipeptide/oligopeptide/nickel transport system ATPase subunit